MSSKVERSIKKLVTDECANHSRVLNGIRDYCCTERSATKQCIYFTSEGSRCKYFENYVLPLDNALQVAYREDRIEQKQEANIKDCIECGKALVIKSNRQKYCDGCARKINSEKSRKRMEKFRHGKRESRRYDLEFLST